VITVNEGGLRHASLAVGNGEPIDITRFVRSIFFEGASLDGEWSLAEKRRYRRKVLAAKDLRESNVLVDVPFVIATLHVIIDGKSYHGVGAAKCMEKDTWKGERGQMIARDRAVMDVAWQLWWEDRKALARTMRKVTSTLRWPPVKRPKEIATLESGDV